MHVPSSSGAELSHGRRRLTRVFLAVGLVAVLSGAASAQLEAQASLEAELQLTLDDEPGDGGRPPAPASFGPRPVAGRKPTPLSGEGDGLPLGLKNNSVVELPIFEYTVLREVREALFTGPGTPTTSPACRNPSPDPSVPASAISYAGGEIFKHV